MRNKIFYIEMLTVVDISTDAGIYLLKYQQK